MPHEQFEECSHFGLMLFIKCDTIKRRIIFLVFLCSCIINSRVDTDVLMEVAYSCNFLAVSDSSTCPDIGTS